METGRISPEFARAARQENELHRKRDGWSVLLFGCSAAAIVTSLAALLIYKIFPTQKFGVKFTAVVAGIWLVTEIVAVIGYIRARSKHLRAEEDLDVACRAVSSSSPRE